MRLLLRFLPVFSSALFAFRICGRRTSSPRLQPQVTITVSAVSSLNPNSSLSAVFYATYKFFESRNLLLRSTFAFAPSDNCDAFVALYDTLFGPDHGKARKRRQTDRRRKRVQALAGGSQASPTAAASPSAATPVAASAASPTADTKEDSSAAKSPAGVTREQSKMNVMTGSRAAGTKEQLAASIDADFYDDSTASESDLDSSDDDD